MPSSSIVSSPMPDSCTMRTSSRIRSARALSTDASSSSSALARPRIAAQQPLGVLAEEAEQQQLFLARGHAFGLLAQLAERRDDVLLRLGVVRQLDRALDRRIDRPGRRRRRRR